MCCNSDTRLGVGVYLPVTVIHSHTLTPPLCLTRAHGFVKKTKGKKAIKFSRKNLSTITCNIKYLLEFINYGKYAL